MLSALVSLVLLEKKRQHRTVLENGEPVRVATGAERSIE